MNLVITDECLQLYSEIFSFMLQLKRCVWVLKEIFHRLKRGRFPFMCRRGSSNNEQVQTVKIGSHVPDGTFAGTQEQFWLDALHAANSDYMGTSKGKGKVVHTPLRERMWVLISCPRP